MDQRDDARELSLAQSLLDTPVSTGALLERTRLVVRFDTAVRGPLTVVSGEPAAGKTSLVLEWLRSPQGQDRRVAWLTLDDSCNDPGVFWRYTLAAVGSLDVRTEDLATALADDPVPSNGWLNTFANRLADLADEPLVVIDDFHVLDDRGTLERFHYLAARLGPTQHLVLLTRVKPPWRLDRWRANGRLAEIDARDLRFTHAEVQELVDRAGGPSLTAEDVTLLADRTEGWAGGLRLALLSLAHVDDRHRFLEGFAGDDELVASYLFREVLDSQSQEVRDFLLDISVLERFDPDLCDEIRGSDDSASLLDRCRAANLFVVDLDTHGNRCRLHALFAHLLRSRLKAADPDRLRALHERASAAWERRGDVHSAVTHAVAAGGDTRTGELIARYAGEVAQRGEFETIRRWLSHLPRGEFTGSPEAALGLISTLCLSGHPDEALDVLARLAGEKNSPRVAFAAQQLRGMVLIYTGRVDELAAAAAPLREDVPAGDLVLPFQPRRQAGYLEAIDAYFRCDLDEAEAAAEGASAVQEQPGLFWVEIPGWWAQVAVAQGRLDDVVRHASEAFRRGEAMQSGDTAVFLPTHLALADLCWERNELDAAADHLSSARRTVRPLLWMAVVVQLSVSRLQASAGELHVARQELADAVQTYWTGATSPSLLTRMHRTAIDLALRAGDVDGASRWQRAQQSIGTRLDTALELRLGRASGAVASVEHVEGFLAEVDEPLPRRIDALLAGAEVLADLGAEERAMAFVAEATRLGEPQGYVRRFVESGARALDILSRLADPATSPVPDLASPAYVDQLIAAAAADAGSAQLLVRPAIELVDPLSDREVEVLERLSEGLSYREMADQLFISRNTVKTHVRHVYAKLGVASRDGAVEEARRLGIA